MIEQRSKQEKRARILAVIAVGAVLAATLWPFNPFPKNDVVWLKEGPGLRFGKAGLALSRGSLHPPADDAESYTIELLLTPDVIKRSHTILAFYTPNREKELLVRQWTDGLIVTHDARFDRDRTRTIKFDVDHVFKPGQLVQVTISSSAAGTTVYLDGTEAEFVPQFRISRAEITGQIVLGTSPVTYHPWSGELRGLAIYSKALDASEAARHYRAWTKPNGSEDLVAAVAYYSFDERTGSEVHNAVRSGPDLKVPSKFSVPHKTMLRSLASEFEPHWRYVIDLVMNVAGFVPLGVIVCAYLGWKRNYGRAILLTILSCGFLSLVIEILQYYIPRRGSGVTDIVTNTIGAAIGAMMVRMTAIRAALRILRLVPPAA